MRLVDLPERVPRRKSAFWRAAGRAILGLYGWNVEGEVPNLPKFVVAVAPHTSNWDFVIGVAVMFALGLKIAFLGKHSIFVWPFSMILRWMGGVPVDRASPHGVVGESIRAFSACDSLILAIAPEGTRKPVAHFREGFLHIARGAGVPVVLAALDYGHKCVRFGPTIQPGADLTAERELIEAYFSTIRGKRAR